MATPMRTVSIKLPAPLDATLSGLARRHKSSRSAVVREAVEALANREHRSVTRLVDELVGVLDGPPDLSTHPRYLRGYGK